MAPAATVTSAFLYSAEYDGRRIYADGISDCISHSLSEDIMGDFANKYSENLPGNSTAILATQKWSLYIGIDSLNRIVRRLRWRR